MKRRGQKEHSKQGDEQKQRERVFEDDLFTENTRLVIGSKRKTKIYAQTLF